VVVVNFICDCAIGGGCQLTASYYVADFAAMDGGCQLTASYYVADFAAMDRNSSSQGSSIEEIGTKGAFVRVAQASLALVGCRLPCLRRWTTSEPGPQEPKLTLEEPGSRGMPISCVSAEPGRL
jgi:hypothetical protein